MLEIVIATTNKGKVRELKKLLSNFPIKLKSLDNFGDIPEVEETGQTFLANAELKAKYYASKTNYLVLADDSGLEVESLNNAPGVFSARYSGINATDQDNINKLLEELKKSEESERKARFVCEMVLADPNGHIIFSSRGVCPGIIALKPFGNNGFGYDPVFIPDHYSKTFGELPNKIKRQISHRAKATKKIIKFLTQFRTS
jgi:XTP/dITP diphosphohydrolase